jgi:predicted GNAT family acetyltransferase
MLIQQKETDGNGKFYVEVNGEILAEMEYTMPSKDKMIISHTEVDASLSGKGVGVQLLHALVDYARTENIKIIPLCPFAKAIFNKRPEFRDVLL